MTPATTSSQQQDIPATVEEAQVEMLALLRSKAERRKGRLIDTVFVEDGPLRRDLYPKHMEFFAAGSMYRERVAFGGNRTGKSWLGGYEAALHLTGRYPDWWRGRRFNRPVTGVVCGKTGRVARDSVQKVLLGPKEAFGTGFIAKEYLNRSKCTMSRAASGMFDEVPVQHISGGTSTLRLKSYDQGREAFEATELDFVWEDEEAPLDIHKENLMRTMTTNGIVFNTFTPLKGETELVKDLRKRAADGAVYQVSIWWDDCPHLTQQMISDMLTRYARHEIRARRYGEPQLGSGAVFMEDQSVLMVRPFDIPDYWPRAFGFDFGWTHPTAAIWGALDRETDTVYLYSEHRLAGKEPAIHAAAVKARGDWIPGISETQGTTLDTGKKMFDLYKKDHHLKLHKAAKGPDSVEPGVLKMQERITQGRLKVFDNLRWWFEEYRAYHRDSHGAIVAVMNDLMDSTRYLLTGIHKYAKTQAEVRAITGIDNAVIEVRFGQGRLR